MPPTIVNEGAKGIPYYTPAQIPPAGTADHPQPDGSQPPKLFQPLKLRGLTLQNRIMLSPLCQYSAEDGHHTPWHLTHLGGIIQRGPGLAMIEATAVTAEGRITPEDSGLWKDSQIEPLRRVVEFAHSQGQKIGIQLGHAGRKASTVAPWLSKSATATKEAGGWPDNVLGPGDEPFDKNNPVPKPMTKADIEHFKTSFVASVRRAITAGFDTIEIHAHGYLLHSFFSPATNKRTDEYGGSFENRTRLLMEIIELTRAELPEHMPLILRISATDLLEESLPELPSWKVADTVRLAEQLVGKIDLLDVSSGGNHVKQRIHVPPGVAYQAPFAIAVKDKVGDKLAVGTVGGITNGKMANKLLEEDGLDLVAVGRAFQKNPGLVFAFADDLNVDVRMPNQIGWAFRGRGKKVVEQKETEAIEKIGSINLQK